MKKNRLNTITSLALGLSFTGSVIASDFDDSFALDLQTVTSANRIAESMINSSSSVTVIDKTMIEASGFTDLADVFRLVPGYQVAHVNGNTFAVVPHGFGHEWPNRLQLLIDGRSTYLPTLSAIDWLTLGIELEDIERIEVVRGPAPSAFGSNSFAGAVNIITREPAIDEKNQVRVRIGNNGDRSTLLRHSFHNDTSAYRISASHNRNDGFDELSDTSRYNRVNAVGSINLDASNTVKTHFSFTDISVPDTLPGDATNGFFFPVERTVKAISGHINWSHKISSSEELKANIFHNYRDEDDLSESVLLSEAINVNPAAIPFIFGAPDQRIINGRLTARSHRTDLEVQYSKIFDTGAQYVVGLGGRYDTLSSEILIASEDTISEKSFRAFGNVQLPFKSQFVANFAGLIEKNDQVETKFSPKFGLNWHINENHTLRSSYARAYRIPSLLERHYSNEAALSNGFVLGTPYRPADDIIPETIDSYEIGYLGKHKQLPINWELKLYKEQYDHVTDTNIDETVTNFINEVKTLVIDNAANFSTHGIEGEITYRPKQNDFIRFHFNVSNGEGTTISRYKDSGITYREIDKTFPSNSLGLLASKSQFGLQWNLGVYHLADTEWWGDGDIVDGYTRVDASVSKTFKMGSKSNLKLKLSGQNIGNQNYNEFDDVTEFEPRYFFTVSYTQD